VPSGCEHAARHEKAYSALSPARKALDNFGVIYAKFIRIGLTRDQVRNLPPRLRRGIDVKPSDSHAKSFIAQYGEHC
jgi:hypothetical protein